MLPYNFNDLVVENLIESLNEGYHAWSSNLELATKKKVYVFTFSRPLTVEGSSCEERRRGGTKNKTKNL